VNDEIYSLPNESFKEIQLSIKLLICSKIWIFIFVNNPGGNSHNSYLLFQQHYSWEIGNL